MEFRKYQSEIITTATNVLRQFKFVYLAMEVRTGSEEYTYELQ